MKSKPLLLSLCLRAFFWTCASPHLMIFSCAGQIRITKSPKVCLPIITRTTKGVSAYLFEPFSCFEISWKNLSKTTPEITNMFHPKKLPTMQPLKKIVMTSKAKKNKNTVGSFEAPLHPPSQTLVHHLVSDCWSTKHRDGANAEKTRETLGATVFC